jgi:hypothetical protein
VRLGLAMGQVVLGLIGRIPGWAIAIPAGLFVIGLVVVIGAKKKGKG